ncbi:type II toxin-antitoxin system VapC family toxin [Candidatus Woesearchaeota archaeon]|nr:type II toxin-antitoxin system VapC family toxin [Candidatus Woesearchaeota archaeon]
MKYIDTSAFVKYYASEETEKGATKVAEVIEQAKKGEIILISSIFLVGEAISVFDKWIRKKIIDEDEGKKIISEFIHDIIELTENDVLILETINHLTILSSLELIQKYHIPINDAIHFHTMLTYKSIVKEFICSDKQFIEAVKKEKINVYNTDAPMLLCSPIPCLKAWVLRLANSCWRVCGIKKWACCEQFIH